MAILQLKSTNPKLSYVIAKNPETGLIVKNLRLGKLFGFFSDKNQTYNIYFKDSPNEISFTGSKPGQFFEYLDTTRYGSAHFNLNAISDFFSSLMKGGVNEKFDTEGFKNEVFINLYKISNIKYIELFTKYLPDYKITAVPVALGHYKLSIATEKSLCCLVNFTALFTIFNVLKNPDEYLEGDPLQIAKYSKCLAVVAAPYFIKYVFKVNLLRTTKTFKTFKETLESNLCGDEKKIELIYGSTAEQRLNYLKENICYDYHICEIGCGKAEQTTSFAKKTHKRLKQVYAIDTDPECREIALKRIERKNFDNVTILESFEAFKQAEKPEGRFEYILSEVIEHLEKREATKLVADIIKYACEQNARSLTITTPNADFNTFYALEGFRHDDHKFEFAEEEFKNWVHKLCKRTDYKVYVPGIRPQNPLITDYKFFGIGDIVNDIPTTLGVRIAFAGGEETK